MVRILFGVLFVGSVASDPDPVQDYCIAVTDSETYIPCKNPSLVTVEDFIFSGLNSTGNFSETGQAVLSVNVNNFPGLRTQGVSLCLMRIQEQQRLCVCSRGHFIQGLLIHSRKFLLR
ncbi:hypothetical protein NC653_026435 [Populus alba x Populus x berolinensis]|uniref:Uncharacterized protein n=1 Tax=Populus alba x Populus x berolinensis TaxID=444605 RepID=A0AAD6QA99_9ROSI|nr:hypothetical protein NC653_026435 [Populus alba x Populus x berolinensis]